MENELFWYGIIQISLLILKYGGMIPNLPWWVMWMPTIIVGVIIGVAMIILIAIMIWSLTFRW